MAEYGVGQMRNMEENGRENKEYGGKWEGK